MAGVLAALLDDVAAMARLAASSIDDVAAASVKASSKAAGIVVDDAAVTPQYVSGIDPKRELPIIWRITKGSLRNKLVFILPVALLLSIFLPFLLTPLLMIGGSYLCFEGAEKVWELIRGKKKTDKPAVVRGPEAEQQVVSSAVRTDLILSAEIMVISLNEVADQHWVMQAAILVVVAIGITILVYGTVGLLVKMDDIGLSMTTRDSSTAQRIGHGLVAAMPKVMTVISFVGMIAMLWVGGHIILVGMDELGAHYPYAWVHDLEELVHHVAGIGGVLAWLINTFCSFVFGLIWGGVIAVVVHFLPFGHGKGHDEHGDEHAPNHAPSSSDGTPQS